MKRILTTVSALGTIIGAQAANAIPPRPQIISTQQSQSVNQMTNLLAAWGFNPIACQGNVAEITHSATGESACVQPNAEMGVGKFIYDASINQIRQDSNLENQLATINNHKGSLSHVNPVSQTQDPRFDRVVFTFDNLYDYGTCLDAILLAYEGRGAELQNMQKNNCAMNVIGIFGTNLAKDITLQLIDLANFRATELLNTELYPTFGLRRRVAMNLGYIYKNELEATLQQQPDSIVKAVGLRSLGNALLLGGDIERAT